MSAGYDHEQIEKKWQERWAESNAFAAPENPGDKKEYVLAMFPYPSGEGIHLGHAENYTATDIYSRFKRMQGKAVLHPIGWDAFGLPAENYAIKTGTPPQQTTDKAINNFRRQLKSLGISFDWEREVGAHTPEYYKWTQWFFLFLFKHGLAEKRLAKVNWCPKDQTVLANEQTVSESGEKGVCVRCGTKVVQKDLEQWFFKITEYADALVDDLDKVDWPESTKINQRNWIGRSEGAQIQFPISNSQSAIEVFTTRPDTLFGATYMVLAPEHPLVEELADRFENKEEVLAYVEASKNKTDLERQEQEKKKTGVEIRGIKAVNPANKEEIPIYVADYVLWGYGTGAIMAVPAHDERDFEFAKKFNLAVKEVVVANIIDRRNPPVPGKKIVERQNVHAIVRDPKTGTYLALKWKKFDWTTFPMGGVEDGESIEEAARREVKEETGYTNLKLLRVLPDTVRAEYFCRTQGSKSRFLHQGGHI
jgi:leucyl-tRNA synthetase